jgi:hypothetical protein
MHYSFRFSPIVPGLHPPSLLDRQCYWDSPNNVKVDVLHCCVRYVWRALLTSADKAADWEGSGPKIQRPVESFLRYFSAGVVRIVARMVGVASSPLPSSSPDSSATVGYAVRQCDGLRYAIETYSSYSPTGPTSCRDCSPGLHERLQNDSLEAPPRIQIFAGVSFNRVKH